MAATEKITILRVGTDEAVRNIQDLKTNISELKKQLNDLDIGSEEYNKTLQELSVNQNALKDAMHYTTTETKTAEQAMDGIAVAARGAGESYNALVNRLKSLKEEWRATEDVARRNELGKQINEVNQKLKDLDASTGSFKRNVGDYEGAIKRTADGFRATAGEAGRAIGPINSITAGFKALSKTPVVAVLGLIAAALAKIISGLKSSEENMNRVALAMSSFQGAGDLFMRLMQNIGNGVAWVAERIGELAEKALPALEEATNKRKELNLTLQKYYSDSRNFMEMNALSEVKISRLRQKAIEVDEYSAKERAQFLKEAMAEQEKVNARNLRLAQQEEDIANMRSNLYKNDKEANDALARATANRIKVEAQGIDAVTALQRQYNKIMKQARKDTKDDVDAVADSIDNATNQISAKAIILQEIFRNMSSRERWTKFLEEDLREFEDIAKADAQALSDEIDSIWEKHFEKEMERTEQLKKARVDMMNTLVSTASSILGSVADIYESLSGEDEKAARNTKAIRIAAAVIDTIAGAISAFTSAQSIPPPAGQIIGAANAAAVVAAGTANIAKIRATDISKNAGSSAASLTSFSSPTVTSSVPQTTIVRGAQDEAILNQMGKPSRVYILQSDIEAAGKSSRARVAESAFN